jgi:hypothetical protein
MPPQLFVSQCDSLSLARDRPAAKQSGARPVGRAARRAFFFFEWAFTAA